MTHNEAYDALPKDAKWSCSFGYPGEAGFVEIYRTPDGRCWEISNGRDYGTPQCFHEWSCEQRN